MVRLYFHFAGGLRHAVHVAAVVDADHQDALDINVEDCKVGSGRWRNIQESVRFAVVSLCSVIASQARSIRALEAKVWPALSSRPCTVCKTIRWQ